MVQGFGVQQTVQNRNLATLDYCYNHNLLPHLIMSESNLDGGVVRVLKSDAGKVNYLFIVGQLIVINQVGEGEGVAEKWWEQWKRLGKVTKRALD